MKTLWIPTIDLAAKAGDHRLANMAMLGALIEETQVLPMEAVVKALKRALDKRYHNMIPLNAAALGKGPASFGKGVHHCDRTFRLRRRLIAPASSKIRGRVRFPTL